MQAAVLFEILMKQKHILFFLLATTIFSACIKEDELKLNTNPNTNIFLEKIDRAGENRLNTNVTMHWSADDQDGYVVGYEVSLDNITWSFTTKQDSVFRFSILNGDTTDINLYVRAIDNDGNKDLTPAYLKIPIKNTIPTVAFDDNLIKCDSVYSVFSLLFSANDLDGNETIDSIYLKINNGNWFALSKQSTFVTFVPNNPTLAGNDQAKVYLGYDAIKLNKQINGLLVDGSNQVFLKARDFSGAESAIDTLSPFFLRRKTSDLLVLDAYNIATIPNADVVYKEVLQSVYGAVDYYDFFRQNKAYFPSIWKPTFSLFLNLYDKVFWYSDNIASNNNAMLLESGASAIQNYLNADGKLFVCSDFANNAYPLAFSKTSPVFQFSPADSFQTFFAANQKASIPKDSLMVPNSAAGNGYPTLLASSFADAVDPFFEKSNATVIYTANTKRNAGLTNTKVVMAKTQNANGKTNQVFCSIDLFKMQGDANANGQQDELKQLFQKIFLDEFNW